MKALIALVTMCGYLALPIAAQRIERNDLVVFNNNDTLYGKVHTVGSFVGNKTWVVLKKDGTKTRYSMADVRALRIKGRDFLKQEFIHIKWPLTAYLRVEAYGKITLLYMPCQTSRINYDLFALLETGELIFIDSHGFYTKLWPLLQLSPTFLEKAAGSEVRFPRYNRKFYDNIKQYIDWYNGVG